MAVELATVRPVVKPWGRVDLQPWSDISKAPDHIGELWITRPSPVAIASSLLFKLIFADEPLSIQVHPDDAFAHAHGLPNGKTEAWYILAAKVDAKIAVGLKRAVTEDELLSAVNDGSINRLVDWRSAVAGQIVLIPAGTIHAIGAGVTLAEIQQCSDTTFRIYDFNRGRDLQVEDALSVANTSFLNSDASRFRLTDNRDILVENPYFVIERIDLPPQSSWRMATESETTIFILDGSAAIGHVSVRRFSSIFLGGGDCERIETGDAGLSVLVSYCGPAHAANLLMPIDAASGADLAAPKNAGPA